jgi:uncharacterized repeat protein (TIGR03803 family)
MPSRLHGFRHRAARAARFLTAALLAPTLAWGAAALVYEKPLVSFTGSNGIGPNATLLLASDGKLYGSTRVGGSGWPPSAGSVNAMGTVFSMTPSGRLTTLHSFSGPTDGAFVYSPLMQASDGNLYGMTESGGTTVDGARGAGTIFRITPAGDFASLHTFTSDEGGFPAFVPLLQRSDGALYGVAQGPIFSGHGCAFKMALDGTFSVLHCFTGGDDGDVPFALIQGGDGNFYGTTAGLAYFQSGPGYGTVFRMTPAGVVTTLYRFQGGADGIAPDSLVQTADGTLYGTTAAGGSAGAGTFFSIALDGSYRQLHAFDGAAEGATPNPGLVLGADGRFYGTTETAGASGGGTAFRLTAGGALTTLYNFSDSITTAGLTAGRSRRVFYGATQGGGDTGDGSAYRLTIW